MEGCKYCTANEPKTSLGEMIFDEMITEKGDLKGCLVGIVITPGRSAMEFNVCNAGGVGDTTIQIPIKYCPMCGRKLKDVDSKIKVIEG
jgi:hypothetical protein